MAVLMHDRGLFYVCVYVYAGLTDTRAVKWGMMLRAEQDLLTARPACTAACAAHTGKWLSAWCPSIRGNRALRLMWLHVLETTGGCPQAAQSGARAFPAQSAGGHWYCLSCGTESERTAAVTASSS